jgi:hypothetical protein
VQYAGPVDYSIRFAIEWSDFDIISFLNRHSCNDKSESSLVCKLQLHSMIDEDHAEFVPDARGYYSHADTAKTSGCILGPPQRGLPRFILRDHPFLNANGCMYIPVDIYRRGSKTTVQAKANEIVNQYMAIESTRMYPKEEDPDSSLFPRGYQTLPCCTSGNAAARPWTSLTSLREEHLPCQAVLSLVIAP